MHSAGNDAVSGVHRDGPSQCWHCGRMGRLTVAIEDVEAVEHHGDGGLLRLRAAGAAASLQIGGQTCAVREAEVVIDAPSPVLALELAAVARGRSGEGRRWPDGYMWRRELEPGQDAAVKRVVEEHAVQAARWRLNRSMERTPPLNGAWSRRAQLPTKSSRPGDLMRQADATRPHSISS
jgi:hypothetical protein